MIRAAFPGSFDPPTFGHIDIIERSRSIFDELVVVIAENKQKHYLFSAEERRVMMIEMVKDWKNVSVMVCDTLIVELLKRQNIKIMVRGVRNVMDFSYESELSMMNKALSPDIETIFMMTRPEYLVLRSSSVRELAAFNGDLSALTPPLVAAELRKKFMNLPAAAQ
ncbi:MAG: pantetheine-phosphate adenylyltransferase [Spirochaetaceae bacterium]|nr:pantetheine-phosphate adenylyltransferase [Spirochaetaceae bacterium]